MNGLDLFFDWGMEMGIVLPHLPPFWYFSRICGNLLEDLTEAINTHCFFTYVLKYLMFRMSLPTISEETPRTPPCQPTVPVADMHRHNNLSDEIYEVKRYFSSGQQVQTFDLASDSVIDVNRLVESNNKIQSVLLLSEPASDKGFYRYEIKFHNTFTTTRVRRMFPGCFVFPKPSIQLDRVLVKFDVWNNVYVPI